MWTRYTSFGESGSRKGWRDAGALVNGGRGPDCELGVEAPDDDTEGVTEAFAFPARLADLAISYDRVVRLG